MPHLVHCDVVYASRRVGRLVHYESVNVGGILDLDCVRACLA